jgi:hypothetical protein
MPSFDSARRPFVGLDSLPQNCGLSLPTFTHERIGTMPTAACRLGGNPKSLDFLTGNYGPSLPTLLERDRHHGHRRSTASNEISRRPPATHATSQACPAHRQCVLGTGSAGWTACEDGTDPHRAYTSAANEASWLFGSECRELLRWATLLSQLWKAPVETTFYRLGRRLRFFCLRFSGTDRPETLLLPVSNVFGRRSAILQP